MSADAAASQGWVTSDYWRAFQECLGYRIQSAVWKPFQVLKIFKLGLHWVVLLRRADLDPNSKFTYWVTGTWDEALAKASEIATVIRQDFDNLYTQKN